MLEGEFWKCSHGANLLLNFNPKETFKIATELNQYNLERKVLENDLFKEIDLKVKKILKDPVLILNGKNWHEGIIGIIASRIKDKYQKPTIIITENNNFGKASARSIHGFDIGSIIIAALQNQLLIKGGGHKMAGGFTIEMINLEKFKSFIFNKFNLSKIDFEKKNTIFIDSEISPTALNLNFFSKIDMLSPFGSGNPEPKFMLKKVKPVKSEVVGGKHIKSLLLAADGSTLKSIAFNTVDSEISPYLLDNKRHFLNIVGKLTLNEWRGEKK